MFVLLVINAAIYVHYQNGVIRECKSLNRSDQYWKDKVIGKFKLARIGLPLSYDITL